MVGMLGSGVPVMLLPATANRVDTAAVSPVSGAGEAVVILKAGVHQGVAPVAGGVVEKAVA